MKPFPYEMAQRILLSPLFNRFELRWLAGSFFSKVCHFPIVNVPNLWSHVWEDMWLMDKGAAVAAFSLPRSLIPSPNWLCHAKRYTLQLYMATVGAQTPQPCLRTYQYFSSKGTKHLEASCCLTALNTGEAHLEICSYRLGVCDIGGVWGPPGLQWRWQKGGMRAPSRLPLLCVVSIDFILTRLFFLHPYLISVSLLDTARP